eukprot:m.220165 g.220165  ORF g.220165 m.220165 type:complete len:272 (+) comp39934_c1_seq68:1620-2435(+)
MDFPFSLTDGLLPHEITILDRTSNRSVVHSKRLTAVVDTMGRLSAAAQGLRRPITTAEKWASSPDQKLYVLKDEKANTGNGSVIGILKTGRKKLFLCDYRGKFREVEPLCLLDFYVHESRQRGGHGKQLLEHMLKCEGMKAHQLVIDRPSLKCLGFFSKHYNLKSYVKQANNFVAFDQFFNSSLVHSLNCVHTLGQYSGFKGLASTGRTERFGNWSGQQKSWSVGILPGLSPSPSPSLSKPQHSWLSEVNRHGYHCDKGASFRLNSYSRYR